MFCFPSCKPKQNAKRSWPRKNWCGNLHTDNEYMVQARERWRILPISLPWLSQEKGEEDVSLRNAKNISRIILEG